MSDERLASLKEYAWSSLPGPGHGEVYRELIAEIDSLRAENATERKRAEFWKAEAEKRAEWIKSMEWHDYCELDVGDKSYCPECFGCKQLDGHETSCDLARLMTMPEEPKS